MNHLLTADSLYADGSMSAAANNCRNPGGVHPWPWCLPVERGMWEYCSFDGLVCRRKH